VDLDSRRQVSSLELTLPGGSGHGGSTRWLQHEEGQAVNLTEGFTGRLDGGVRPAVEEQNGDGEASIVWWYERGEVE
jgi:hypothetical protein